TLAVARRLKTAIEGRLGIRVLLTREDDRRVSLDERTSLENNNKADLFISLHANASLRRSTSGAAIFSASFATAAARDAAAEGSERVPTFAGGLRDIQLVPWDLAQTHHLDQSTMFTGMVLQQLTDRVPLAPSPVTTAPLRVLASANMPAVLIEMGYLTNPEQERLLSGESFQSSFVQGVFEQAREIVAAQIAPAMDPMVSAVPAGTTLRALFITDRGDAYVDLSGTIVSGHPGGVTNEMLTVYAIVNALTANLPAVTAVQVLVDGKEVETLAGHVDLRRPLEKNVTLVQ